MLVHANARQLCDRYVLIPFDIPARVPRSRVASRALPRDWRDTPAPRALAQLGDAWLDARASALLIVPSAVAPVQLNYILNPDHAAFARCTIGAPARWVFDPRLKR